jgi:prevent-host-death family protein
LRNSRKSRKINVMETRLTAFEARRQFGKVLTRIGAGERLIVERHGEPVAAIVPMEVYAQWQRAREEFMGRVRELAERAGMEAQDAERVIASADALDPGDHDPR